MRFFLINLFALSDLLFKTNKNTSHIIYSEKNNAVYRGLYGLSDIISNNLLLYQLFLLTSHRISKKHQYDE